MIDYGTISVRLLPGLTWDQKVTIVKMCVENQLITIDRSHYIEILHHCIEMMKVMRGEPFSIRWSIDGKYQYVYDVQVVSYGP